MYGRGCPCRRSAHSARPCSRCAGHGSYRCPGSSRPAPASTREAAQDRRVRSVETRPRTRRQGRSRGGPSCAGQTCQGDGRRRHEYGPQSLHHSHLLSNFRKAFAALSCNSFEAARPFQERAAAARLATTHQPRPAGSSRWKPPPPGSGRRGFRVGEGRLPQKRETITRTTWARLAGGTKELTPSLYRGRAGAAFRLRCRRCYSSCPTKPARMCPLQTRHACSRRCRRNCSRRPRSRFPG
jgi:hypothetical protein